MDAAAQLDQVTEELGIDIAADAFESGLSGSQVRRATRADGTPVIVKLTIAAEGWDRTAAERELAFYQELRSRVGVRTPDLLAHHRSDACVAIVLSGHDGVRSPTEWTRDQWLELSRALAALHETPFPPGDLWRHGPDGVVPGSDPERWRSYWERPGEPELFRPIFDDPAALITAVRAQPRCFTHGDCHTDNLLVEADGLVWTDWQSTGIGRPAGELAFAAGRAVPSGATVPLPEMIKLYAERRGLDPVELDRSVLASALSTTLFAWPAYAGYNSAAGIDRVHDWARRLADRWLDPVP